MEILTVDGRPFVTLDIHDTGEPFGDVKWGNAGASSTYALDSAMLESLGHATNYWAELWGAGTRNTAAAVITVGAGGVANNSYATAARKNNMTELAAVLTANLQPDNGNAALVVIGEYSETPSTGPLVLLPDKGDSNFITKTFVHELGHAMGILSEEFKAGTLNIWDSHLVDSFGTKAEAGMRIRFGIAAEPGNFVIDTKGSFPSFAQIGYVYFQGGNVADALGGTDVALGGADNRFAIPGVPIRGYDLYYGFMPVADLSHVELRNSVMSHQSYRNWNTYMEAELALLQDIGIPIDRKNFYNHSVYRDNSSQAISLGFYGRNASGTAYVPGAWNTASLAIGLHVYGCGNTLAVSGEVLSAGYSSAGIRIDGWNNALTLDAGARIAMRGEGSMGMLVAYGKEHSITQRGRVVASGAGGIGARFDFGGNALGDSGAYRGSWIYTANRTPGPVPEHLRGPLVSEYNLTGALSGDKAAIHIAENAHVERINIMRGASLTGDIRSDWNSLDPRVQRPAGGDRLDTALTFGFLPDSAGRATKRPDSGFNLEYGGDIVGRNSLNVSLEGGTLVYSGSMDVRSYASRADSTLLFPFQLKNAVGISAERIALERGSLVGVRAAPFTYGKKASGSYTVARFAASGALVNESSISGARGILQRGFHDQAYGLRWSGGAPGEALLVADILSSRVSRERSGSSALTAPRAIVTQLRYGDMLRKQSAKRFAGRGRALAIRPPASAREMTTHSGSGGTDSDGSASIVPAGRFALWIQGAYLDSRRYGQGGRFRLHTPGVGFGADFFASDSFLLGAGAYLARPHYRSGHADVDASSVTGMVYGTYSFPREVELGGFFAVGHTRYDQTRTVQSERHTTDYSGMHYSLGTSLGRRFAVSEAISARPFASYEYIHTDTDSYKEEARDWYALSFGRSTANAHRLEAGSEFNWNFARGEARFSLYYSGLYGDNRAEAHVAFRNASGGGRSITAKGFTEDEHSLGLGLGAGLELTPRIRLGAEYGMLVGRRMMTHEANANLSFAF